MVIEPTRTTTGTGTVGTATNVRPDWRPMLLAWSEKREVPEPAEVFRGTPEELALLATELDLPPLPATDLSWLDDLTTEHHQGIATAASRSLIARGALRRTSSAALEVEEGLGRALEVLSTADLLIESAHTACGSHTIRALAAVTPDVCVVQSGNRHDTTVVRTHDPATLPDLLLGEAAAAVAGEGAARVPMEELETIVATGVVPEALEHLGSGPTLLEVGLLSRAGQGWAGTLEQWLVDGHGSAWALTTDESQDVEITPIGGETLRTDLVDALRTTVTKTDVASDVTGHGP